MLSSIQSKLFHVFLRLINKKNWLKNQLALGKHNLYHRPEPGNKTFQFCQVHKFQINGRNIFWLTPKNSKKSTQILYLHGGAYVQGFTKPHWDFLTWLAVESGSTVVAPDYPVAPKFTCRDAFDMVVQLYEQMIEKTPADHITLMGDSAGGGFALALAQRIREQNLPQPARIILLSPWLDITLSNPDIKVIDSKDPFLGIKGLIKAGKLYAGDINPDHYMVSPIHGPLEDLGHLSIFVGSNEILVADARKLNSLMKSKGISVNYHEYPGMVHAWMFLNFPESKKARRQIIELLADQPGETEN